MRGVRRGDHVLNRQVVQPQLFLLHEHLILGQFAADHRHLSDTRDREQLFAALSDISFLDPAPSQANFILCNVIGRSADSLKGFLESRGILVRYYNKPGLTNCIRISVGRPEQIERLLQVLQELDGAAL